MNKMVLFLMRHPAHSDVKIKGLVDGDFLFDEEAKLHADGIIQYYQKERLRWNFPINPFLMHSIKWNCYEEMKRDISENEKELALKIFEGDKTLTYCSFRDYKIDREVLTW